MALYLGKAAGTAAAIYGAEVAAAEVAAAEVAAAGAVASGAAAAGKAAAGAAIIKSTVAGTAIAGIVACGKLFLLLADYAQWFNKIQPECEKSLNEARDELKEMENKVKMFEGLENSAQ